VRVVVIDRGRLLGITAKSRPPGRTIASQLPAAATVLVVTADRPITHRRTTTTTVIGSRPDRSAAELEVVDHQIAETGSQIRRVLVIADHDVGPGQDRAAVGVVHRHASGRTGSGPAVSTAPPQWSRSWISFKTLPHITGGVLTTSWRIFGAVSLVRLRICSTAFGESPTSNSWRSCA